MMLDYFWFSFELFTVFLSVKNPECIESFLAMDQLFSEVLCSLFGCLTVKLKDEMYFCFLWKNLLQSQLRQKDTCGFLCYTDW